MTTIDIRRITGLEKVRFDAETGLVSILDLIEAVTVWSTDYSTKMMRHLVKKFGLMLSKSRFGEYKLNTAVGWKTAQFMIAYILANTQGVRDDEMKKVWRDRLGIEQVKLYGGTRIRDVGGLGGIRYDEVTGDGSVIDVVRVVTGKGMVTVAETLRRFNTKYEIGMKKRHFSSGCSSRHTFAGNFEVCREVVGLILAHTTMVQSWMKKSEWRRRFGIPEPKIWPGFNISRIDGMEGIRYNYITGDASLIDVVSLVGGMNGGNASIFLNNLGLEYGGIFPRSVFLGIKLQRTPMASWPVCRFVAAKTIERSRQITTEMKTEWACRLGFDSLAIDPADLAMVRLLLRGGGLWNCRQPSPSCEKMLKKIVE